MGVRLYPNAKLEDFAKFLGFTEADLARYHATPQEAFDDGEADEKSALLNHLSLFGLGRFNLRLLLEAGFSEDQIPAGETADTELAMRLVISSRFYDPLKENAFAWAAFIKLHGGVH